MEKIQLKNSILSYNFKIKINTKIRIKLQKLSKTEKSHIKKIKDSRLIRLFKNSTRS